MTAARSRTAVFWMAVSFNVILLIAMAMVWLDRGKPTDDRGPQTNPSAKVEPAKVEPAVSYHVTRRPTELRFRVVNAADREPIDQAQIVIDNLNLAPELGDDSDAVTWPDGRAVMRHRFLVWEERRGDETSTTPTFQGPWIHVSAEGYEPRKMPLSDLLENGGGVVGRFRECIVTIQRRRSGDPDLAEWAVDYAFGDGFVNRHLEVGRDGRYHFKWKDDVRTDRPHDDDRYESRGRWSIVDGMLRLFPEGAFSSDLRRLMGNDFVPVLWGGRRYLIPEKERLVFCSEVNQGELLEYMRSGPLDFKDVRERKRPEGLPEVPPEWAPYLLQKPVKGAITEVLADQMAIMNVGVRDGVKSGMEFRRENRLDPCRIKVLFTVIDRCVVRLIPPEVEALPDWSPRMSGMMFPGPQPLAVGERVSF